METVALDKINLEVNELEFVAIMGPSNCSKLSLLNILGDSATRLRFYYFFVKIKSDAFKFQ